MRWQRPFLVLVPVAVLASGALWWKVADPGTGEVLDEPETDDAGNVLGARELESRRRREMQARARNMSFDDRDRAVEPVEPAPYGSGQIDRAAAEVGFDEAMQEVEAFVKTRERIHREEWDTLYRNANDAFAALSMHLDAKDPGDRESLEQAHRRLQEGLRRVRVRGRKFSDI